MRLQVYLSHSGICSRRRALQLVMSGKVKVNDTVITEPSYQIKLEKDIVLLEGKEVSLKQKAYILLNKPLGVTTTKEDRFAKKTVMDLLPKEYKHLFPVGRLDKNTTGLLILTNDGDFAYKLSHPSFRIDKVYIATLDRALSEQHRKQLQKGVNLDDGKTSPCKVVLLKNKKINITIHEGRKRQIKRMVALFRYQIKDLTRVSLGNLSLGNLPMGHWREITSHELTKLRNILK